MVPTLGLEMGIEPERLILSHIKQSLGCEVVCASHFIVEKESKSPGIPKVGLGQ